MDAAIDTLLPRCLPYKLTIHAAQVVELTNSIYDAMSYASRDQTIAATCYLHTASPTTLFDWPTAYASDNSSRIIIQALGWYERVSTPLNIIQSVHMIFRSYLKREYCVARKQTVIIQSYEYEQQNYITHHYSHFLTSYAARSLPCWAEWQPYGQIQDSVSHKNALLLAWFEREI